MTDKPKLKCYKVTLFGESCAVFAQTADKAKFIAVNSYRSTWYETAWPKDLGASRLPEYDRSIARDKGIVWNIEFLKKMPLEANKYRRKVPELQLPANESEILQRLADNGHVFAVYNPKPKESENA